MAPTWPQESPEKQEGHDDTNNREEETVKTLTTVAALLSCVLFSAGPALADNTITIDGNLKYTNYTVGNALNVTIPYTATCNIVFSGLSLRVPNGFTPKGVTGSIASVTGTPASGAAGTSGSVSFDLTFTTLKHAGNAKDFGMAHLNLLLGVDEDCDPETGDVDGVDGSATIPIQISVSTASHP